MKINKLDAGSGKGDKNVGTVGWRTIKGSLEACSKPQLINLLADLHKVSEEARLFLGGRFGDSSVALQPYLSTLKKALSADPMEGEEIDWEAADRTVENYRIAAGNNEGMAELLIAYVYEANKFTLEYGDIDGGYYESVEECFQQAVDHLVLMGQQGEPIASYVGKLEAIVDSTSGIGWGYHDALGDMFLSAFERDEGIGQR